MRSLTDFAAASGHHANQAATARCPLSAATKLTVSPGSILKHPCPSELLLSISISAAAAKLVAICVAAASRTSALCLVISCRLALTDFDDIRDVKVTAEHGWRVPGEIRAAVYNCGRSLPRTRKSLQSAVLESLGNVHSCLPRQGVKLPGQRGIGIRDEIAAIDLLLDVVGGG